MKTVLYLAIGILLGITMFKSELASWFRVYEMFRFDSFHMYGIIGTALFFGVLVTQTIKKKNVKSIYGEAIKIEPKEKGVTRYLVGGIIFGLGWALAGACPGPIFTMIGVNFLPFMVIVVAAVLGTFVYGVLKDKLPH